MIRALVDFALNNKFVVLTSAALLVGWGIISFHNLPVEAYPDIADNYVTIITQWPGRSAEEVEQQVTIPIEMQMGGMPHMTYLRSESIFGLSFVIMIFDDSSVNDWNRQKVLERLTMVNLPNGQNLQPQIGTDWSTTGQIYWYTLRSTNPRYDLMELRSIEDWVLLKQFKSVPNVVDVSDFGGTVREYQVRVDPNKLVSYGLSIGQVEQQLANNNNNAGGSFVEVGMQQMNVRALGLFNSTYDIEQTVLKTQSGTALRVKDIAEVTQGPKIRLGHMARANHMEDGRIVDEPDVIQGGVLLRKGAEEEATLRAIHQKVDELNNGLLPPGVKVVPMLDRTDLLARTNVAAGQLSLLERKRLELARALATEPKLLLLDEIAGGLTEAECQELIATIKAIMASGVSIIWIEHVVHALMAVVDRLLVINFGKHLAEGNPHTVMADPLVQEVYMGIEAE